MCGLRPVVSAHRACFGVGACAAILIMCALAHRADAGGAPRASAAARSDRSAQSVALFGKMLPVLRHPRCMNCHTSTDLPRQGDDRHRHIMNVSRGPDGHGAIGLRCSTCHRRTNQPASGVPGAPDWHLAPLRMAWEGLSPSQLCRVLFAPRKGGLEPGQLVAHLGTPFVRWAWSPGINAHGKPRSTPPMSHRAFVALARRWVATGAECP